jgi:hypothetical protein
MPRSWSVVVPLVVVAACSASTSGPASDGVTPGVDGGPPDDLDAGMLIDAPCSVRVDDPPLLPATHEPIGTSITWDSNPPSSGPHYPYWAAYQTYSSPVPRPYYVHNLEHGTIVFLYNCSDPNGCADVVAAFEAVEAALPTDPICDPSMGVRVRTLITPDPLLDVPIAAVAWGWTYKAECLDPPSLQAFATAHYGMGPEQICTDGIDTF